MSDKKKLIKKDVSEFEEVRLKIYADQVSRYVVNDEELKNHLNKKDYKDWKYSGINRHASATTLAYQALPDTAETITVLYKIKDIQKVDKEVTYAMAYIQQKQKNIKKFVDLLEKKHNLQLRPGDNIYINNICASGSVISKDGEYRRVILNWNSFNVIIEKLPAIKKIYMHINNYFSEVLLERKYILLTQYYFPTDKFKNNFQYETELLCATNKIEIFTIIWFNFYYTYYFGMVSNHINEIFKNLLLKYKHEDIAFFKTLWAKFNIEAIEEFRYICSNYIKGETLDIHIYNKSKIGQKIIPLNLSEAQNFFNIEYGPWKEFLVNTKASDLVVNNITNGFSLSGGWFLIKNSDKLFYDNPSQSDRLEKSQIALKIAELLAQAKLYTYNNINAISEEEKDNFMDMVLYNISQDREITSWLSNEFKHLYNKIQDTINRTKEHIIMSNVSVGLFTEFVGKTVYDAIFFTRQSSYYKNLVPNIFSDENKNNFRKYMFQICYNLYCLNSKLLLIHGDLHLNNLTLNSIFYKKNVNIDIKNPQILYILDAETQYLFDNNFYDICLIDFSRAILHPENSEFYKLNDVPYNVIHNKSQFLNKQVADLLAYLYSTKPEYKEVSASIEIAIKHHYAEYFKILTVLDLFNLTDRFISFFKINSASIGAVSKENIALLYELNKSSEYYLNTVLNKLIMQQTNEEVARMDWPILTIIKDIFCNDLASNKKASYPNITDVYNFGNELKYSLSSFKQFPPELHNKKNATHSSEFSVKLRKEYEDKVLKNFQIVNIIQTRQLEKNL